MMHFQRLALLICMLWTISSCVPESEQFVSSDLVGRWDVTTLSGLMFVEFTPDGRILIHDRGALGEPDKTTFYYQDYTLSDAQKIEGLPGNSKMSEINVLGDNLYFVLENPTTGTSLEYFGKRTEKISNDDQTKILSKTWITVEENGFPLEEENRKISYFSETGLFMIKEKSDQSISMFGWQWINQNQICYVEYQRPTLLPNPICMSFTTISDDILEFVVDGNLIKLESTDLY